MLYRLVRPMQRKGSSNQQFGQRIPADVKALAAGLKLEMPVGDQLVPVTISPKAATIRLSLRTSDPTEVKLRQAQVAAYLATVWEALRNNQPVPLSHRQAVALAGELYRAWADDRKAAPSLAMTHMPDDGSWQVDPDTGDDEPEMWEAVIASLPTADDIEALEPVLGTIVDRLLLRKGIRKVHPSSRAMLLRAFRKALVDGFEVRKRQAGGDYSPDPTSHRFPEWEAPSLPTDAAPKVSLKGLVEDWWKEAKVSGRTVSTYESYRSAFTRLASFLEHDDARMVTPQDIVRFKDHRLAQGLSAKTVGDSELAALRSVFQWAMDNGKLPSNPAEKVKVVRPKKTLSRSKSFTMEEATAILSHALHHKRGQATPKVYNARRWVPWLCAYTGARLGEMVQLRRQDIRHDLKAGIWIATITPEAGTVKDKEARKVVLHPHLIDLGFPAFIEAAPDGYLFLNAKHEASTAPAEDIRGMWRSVKNRVTEFVREVVTDKNVAPNHGWRHLFKTRGREAGIEDSILDAICGHAAKTVGGSYGDVTLKTQAEAIKRFPRFEVPDPKLAPKAGLSPSGGGEGSDHHPFLAPLRKQSFP